LQSGLTRAFQSPFAETRGRKCLWCWWVGSNRPQLCDGVLQAFPNPQLRNSELVVVVRLEIEELRAPDIILHEPLDQGSKPVPRQPRAHRLCSPQLGRIFMRVVRPERHARHAIGKRVSPSVVVKLPDRRRMHCIHLSQLFFLPPPPAPVQRGSVALDLDLALQASCGPDPAPGGCQAGRVQPHRCNAWLCLCSGFLGQAGIFDPARIGWWQLQVRNGDVHIGHC
jgi:hypothetical protein